MTAYPLWLLLLAAAGALALGTVVVTLFLALGRRPQSVSATEVAPVGSEAFLVSVAAVVNAPVRAGGAITVLHNGKGFVPRLLEDLRTARQSITFAVYIWEPGRFSTLVWDALVERARAGVEVRVLLDGIGGFGAEQDRVEELRAAGGRVARFRPPRFGKLTRLHRRNHRRAVVVDGEVAYTGGAAVADEWLGDAQGPEEWRDVMFRGTGPFARSLQSAFAGSWAAVTGEILAGRRFYPAPAAADPAQGPGDAAELPRHLSVISSPADEAHPLRKFFWFSFAGARRTLFLAASYFVPDEHLRGILAERARDGVDVRLLLPNHHTDARPVRWAGQAYYEELLAAGVRIWEYQPTFLHAKYVVADGVWSVVGSANLDIRSKELNEENVLGVADPGLAASLEEAFRRDLERSLEIRPEAWRRRSAGKRLLERGSLLFAEQM